MLKKIAAYLAIASGSQNKHFLESRFDAKRFFALVAGILLFSAFPLVAYIEISRSSVGDAQGQIGHREASVDSVHSTPLCDNGTEEDGWYDSDEVDVLIDIDESE